MTKQVIKQVEDLAAAQGITSLKFYNRKREHMIPTPNDLLEGVGGGQNFENLIEENVNTPVNGLPLADEDSAGELLSESDEELEVDDDIDEDELANLLDDARQNLVDEVEDALNGPEVEENVEDKPEQESDVHCDDGGALLEESSVPELDSEPEEGRPVRSWAVPERYNPSSGQSYAQVLQSGREKKDLSPKTGATSGSLSMLTRKSPTTTAKLNMLNEKAPPGRGVTWGMGIMQQIRQKERERKGLRPAWKQKERKCEEQHPRAICHFVKAQEEVHNLRSEFDSDTLAYDISETAIIGNTLKELQEEF